MLAEPLSDTVDADTQKITLVLWILTSQVEMSKMSTKFT